MHGEIYKAVNRQIRVMSIILVSDIFGKTPALIELGEELNAKAIVDPYDGQDMKFKNESEAYSYFMENVGFDVYLSELLKIIKLADCASTLIGFSVGASAIWQLSDKISSDLVKRSICFYGAQIRNFTEVVPQIEVELIFPKYEPHFDVLELQACFYKTPNVKTSRVDYLHGFMNYYSNNYNQQGYREQVALLCANAN